ncbi:MAG TPA: TonB-dependent receptor, partial [Candidatus Baltobacteraceae bacterium]
GTYPGYASATLGIGTPVFYHQAQVEVGGATPDRNFSWYAGFSGYNQDYRFLTQDNGAPFETPNNIFSAGGSGGSQAYAGCSTVTCQGVKASCPANMPAFNATTPPQGCWGFYGGSAGATSMITDREDVINLHFGIPKKNGMRDDIQVLWSASALGNDSYSSLNNLGGTVNQFFYTYAGAKYAPPTCGQTVTVAGWAGLTSPGCVPSVRPALGAYLPYADQVVYNLPFGTPIASSASNFIAPSIYKAPSTPAHAFGGPIDPYDNSLQTYENDTGIAKLQYTYALSNSAFLRAYGYTFYSDWLQNGPIFGATGESTASLPSPQYDLMTHSVGGALDFNDQINDQNLLTADYNYTQAGVIRFNNSSAIAGAGTTPIGYMAGGKCYDAHSGKAQPCLSSTYYDVALGASVHPTRVFTPGQTGVGGNGSTCDNPAGGFPEPCGWVSNAIAGPTGFANGNATWDTLWNSDVTGSLNTVKPQFSNAAFSDQFRPNDKIMINASLRYDNFTYGLPNPTGGADAFYANMTANYTCVQASNNAVFTTPLQAGQPPPAAAEYVLGDCNKGVAALTGLPASGWVHPNGKTQDGVSAPNFTATSPGSFALDYWQPRVSATFTESPDTVWRFSAGRYAAPPISASVQYLSASGDDRSVWNNTMNLGFYSPFHPIPGITSAQYDFSYERHITGTDMSLKLTPYYTWVNDWQQQTFIGAGFVTQVPVGVNRDYGVEFQFTKGDFNRPGLSGLFSFTYTNSKVQFQNVGLSTGGIIPNQTIQLNQAIAQYNALTKAGGGAPCYKAGVGVACTAHPSHTFSVISNPYYNQPEQGLLDPNGWYNPYVTAIAPNLNGIVNSYISPATATLLLNYRHDKWAITPSVQFQAGSWYGSPLDVNGYDPRACEFSSLHDGIATANPHQCDVNTVYAGGLGPLGYFYIPDPQTGHFSAIGSYEAPAILTGNLQITYDVSPKIKLTATGTNLFRSCFGGTPEPWTAVYQPSPWTCGYFPAGGLLNSTTYPSNFYNGKGITDAKANGGVVTPWTQSYTPSTGNNGAIGGIVTPWNVYLNAQIKI